MNKKYSFKELLTQEVIIDFSTNESVIFDKIEIPRIQRDYAQGRGKIEDNELKLNETGRRFLDSIFKALKGGEIMEMDFIYGSISEFSTHSSKEKKYAFIPLDGQQRLTTLFLLYWYLGSRELKDDELGKLMNVLKKFTYSTRTSSRRFCELLCETTLSFNKLPSIELSNLFWFFKSYKKDPTIKAILNMLDSIHTKYTPTSPLFESLERLQFYILPLNHFNLSEDLYIKMNARGKQLTDFENFKADLIKWMKDDDNIDKLELQKEVNYNNRQLNYYITISQKIDNEWTNMFWNITKTNKEKLVDPLFIRLLYRYFLNRYILLSDSDSRSIEREENFKYFAAEAAFKDFAPFENILSFSEIKKLEHVLDLLSGNWDSIMDAISPSWAAPDGNYFFWGDNFTQVDRTVLLAIILYLDKNSSFVESNFKQWMRVAWNIIENTDIADYSSTIGVMKLLEELSAHSSNIYEYLANPKSNISSASSKTAREEEIWKCSFIFSNNKFNPSWEKAFMDAEKHKFFKGSVSFLMTEDMSIDDFIHRTQLAEKVFDNRGVNEYYRQNGHIFLRGLISQYTVYDQILKRNFTDIDEREHYLKKMLATDPVVRNATRTWFSLKDENELKSTLNTVVLKDSQMDSWDVNNLELQQRLRKIHEELYKGTDLQNWMQQQQTRAIRLGWRNHRLFISRPSAWYDWILIDGFRNEIITALVDNYDCSASNQCSYNGNPIPYYKGNGEISAIRKISVNASEVDLEYCFDSHLVKVGIRETEELREIYSESQFSSPTDTDSGETEDGWICRRIYDYQGDVKKQEDIDAFILKIENDVLGDDATSLLSKLQANGLNIG